MFRTDLLPIIRSLNTVYTAIGICHTGYVDCLLATASAACPNSEPSSSQNIYLRSILISSRLSLCLPSGLFTSGFPTKYQDID